MTDRARLYFSIGPVQSFMAQARRTRDLWAGSFLLSYLANAAMREVEKGRGEIVLPARNTSSRAGDEAPPLEPFGTVPNRFVAKGVGVDVARAAEAAIRDAWTTIAQAVWDDFVAYAVEAGHGHGTRQIWDRQVKNFWEITWVIGPPGCFEARKHWRTPPLRVEGGDHCAVMGDLQELSGYVRARERNLQDQFWAAVRARCNTLDLANDERMCAIALIKRLFPKVAKKTVEIEFPVQNWPSSSYLAAVPWLKRVAAQASGDDTPRAQRRAAMRLYAEQVHSLAGGAVGERYTRIKCLRELGSSDSKFLRLHGNFFFEEQLENASRTPFELADTTEDDERRRELVTELRALYDKVGGRPAPYFALLMMDGDSMGKLLAQARESQAGAEKAEATVTRSLHAFSTAVPKLIEKHNGVTVYAGGDDVVALLPALDALDCADELAEYYRQCFKDHCASDLARHATLSGAIVYAHYATPLREILETAHRLLDDVAKEATGRDSLAIGVLKRDALVCEWSAPWAHLRGAGATPSKRFIDDLVQAFRPGDGERARELGSSFLFGLRAWLVGFCEDAREMPGQFGRLPEEIGEDEMCALLTAEYLRARTISDERDESSEDVRQQARTQAKPLMEKLLRACRKTERKPPTAPDTEPRIDVDARTFGFDGLYLIRFLARDIHEEET